MYHSKNSNAITRAYSGPDDESKIIDIVDDKTRKQFHSLTSIHIQYFTESGDPVKVTKLRYSAVQYNVQWTHECYIQREENKQFGKKYVWILQKQYPNEGFKSDGEWVHDLPIGNEPPYWDNLDEAITNAVYRILPNDGCLCYIRYRLRQIEQGRLDKNPRLFFPVGEL